MVIPIVPSFLNRAQLKVLVVIVESSSIRAIRMKLHLISTTIALLTLAGAAAAADKQVIITYPNDTPDSVLRQAKDAIKAAVGPPSQLYSRIAYKCSREV